MKMTQQSEQALKVAMDLESHEKECAIRYQMVNDKLDVLDKRMWRIEAMIMGSTVVIVGLAASMMMQI
jgi:hypothetical protein